MELVRSSDRPLREIARELGVNPETLRNWVQAAKRAETGGGQELAASEQEDLRPLRARVAKLEKKQEILRTAAAYFATEMGR